MQTLILGEFSHPSTMKRLFSVLVTFGAIFILSEGIIPELNSVVARTNTINALYKEARKASEKTDNAKKDSKLNIKSTTPIIAVKKENALIIDQKSKDTICNTIMGRAAEFGGDIFRGFGEVFQAIREIMPPEYDLKGWTPLGIKILAYHLRGSIFLDNSKQDTSDIFSFYWGNNIDTGDLSSNMSLDTLTQIRERVTSKSKDAGRPPLKKKKPTKVDSNYRSVTVYTSNGSKFSEDVLTCPRMIENNEVGVYFVSKEYNINFASDSLTNPVAARFLFDQNKTTGRMDLIAIAEEPAQPLIDLDSETNIEDIYFERRKGKEPAISRSRDSICRLNESELFRTCSQIFTSKYFADKVKFPASYSSVLEHTCEENVVQFRKRKEGDTTVYSEWMAVCYMGYNPFGYRPKEEWTFYVSRAYNPDTEDKTSTSEVFVYNVENGEIFLMNLFSNVGVRMSKEKNSSI